MMLTTVCGFPLSCSAINLLLVVVHFRLTTELGKLDLQITLLMPIIRKSQRERMAALGWCSWAICSMCLGVAQIKWHLIAEFSYFFSSHDNWCVFCVACNKPRSAVGYEAVEWWCWSRRMCHPPFLYYRNRRSAKLICNTDNKKYICCRNVVPCNTKEAGWHIPLTDTVILGYIRRDGYNT